jgi:hypothetical protein
MCHTFETYFNIILLCTASAGLVNRIQAECLRKLRPTVSKDNSLMSSLKGSNALCGLPSLLFGRYKWFLWVNWPAGESDHIALPVLGFKVLVSYVHHPVWLHIVNGTTLPSLHFLPNQSCFSRAENIFPSAKVKKNMRATCLTVPSSWGLWFKK